MMQLKAAQDRFRLSPPCSGLLGNTPWLKDWFASTRVSAVLLGPVPVIPCQGTGEPRAPSCHQGAVGAARLPGAGLSVLSTPPALSTGVSNAMMLPVVDGDGRRSQGTARAPRASGPVNLTLASADDCL